MQPRSAVPAGPQACASLHYRTAPKAVQGLFMSLHRPHSQTDPRARPPYRHRFRLADVQGQAHSNRASPYSAVTQQADGLPSSSLARPQLVPGAAPPPPVLATSPLLRRRGSRPPPPRRRALAPATWNDAGAPAATLR
eukprot:scaffold628_cov401-Prasinococcus_capsulatus_cf.AAC.13